MIWNYLGFLDEEKDENASKGGETKNERNDYPVFLDESKQSTFGEYGIGVGVLVGPEG